MEVVYVALGGMIGAGSRYGISTFVTVPLVGTLIVNVVGCLLIGSIYALLSTKKENSWIWPFIATGVCGGFTTMSTLSLELVSLMNEGFTIIALAYLVSTILLGIGGVILGISATIKIMGTQGSDGT
ncbi:CrcB family protein [Bacillus sp. BGMRC 2118]|nr:CrcB family protein [Bacillus sp. BGMRC 2118]